MIATRVFETALGWCALAWHPGGIVFAGLPEESRAALVARLAARFPDAAAAAEVPPAAAMLQRHLAGAPAEPLADLVLDYAGVPELHVRVYEVARAIPRGETRTYGEIARAIGAPGAARAVGQALGKNPFAPIVPCHRVLAAGAGMGGFSAHGGLATKQRLLAIEGAWPLPGASLSLF